MREDKYFKTFICQSTGESPCLSLPNLILMSDALIERNTGYSSGLTGKQLIDIENRLKKLEKRPETILEAWIKAAVAAFITALINVVARLCFSM